MTTSTPKKHNSWGNTTVGHQQNWDKTLKGLEGIPTKSLQDGEGLLKHLVTVVKNPNHSLDAVRKILILLKEKVDSETLTKEAIDTAITDIVQLESLLIEEIRNTLVALRGVV